MLPLDLLSFVLERDTSKLVPGVNMKQAGGVRGVSFSSPHTSMSFPSSQLLVNCDLLPKQFSIVSNEYIFSLTEPKKGEKTGDNNEEDILERGVSGKEQHGNREEERRVKSNEEPGRVILGLRFSKNLLHFLLKGHRGVVDRWVFRGTRLDDNQWHTLLLVVGSHHVRLTVDCNSPLEMVPSGPFPPDLNIQGARFHIGSRGRWKGLYSGLLRQLVLVPGSDATHYICPSSDPQLAVLSVPPLLSDLSVIESEGDSHVTSYVTEERVSVGTERLCSKTLQGQMWFNPLSKGLYLCDGTVWITVLEGENLPSKHPLMSTFYSALHLQRSHYSIYSDHKRLDYVSEHQVFQLPGLGMMAAMAHRSASGSAVYLVVSNSGGGPDKRKQTENDFSVIYKWSKMRKLFVRFQTLQTHCARDWEAFQINKQTYLAVANHRQGDTNHTIDSVIYRWNRLTKSFEVHQMLRTSGAYDWEFFTVGPYHFLVVANAFDGVTTSVDSVIYVWVNGSFQVFQTIKTFCATDWEMFQIGSRVFLVVANGHRLQGNGPSQYAINSTIYELDMIGQLFVRFQDIVTYSAVDWEFFSLGEEYFLVVANSFNGESYSLNSVLYRWQGYEGFVPVHWLPTIGCSDWEFFSSKGESYLIYSSAKAPLAKIFKLKTY
ncbi:hypothetical protein F7725_008193 [Dissostichus mawsoni]|uniref:Laminin G domain-containing protein n=1 Tax=Dissostichus mawsoni TaxID=36200 RepID=A0A7J5Y6K8_DISMA|nr:hypothetical protein F7725_008193 [Dissostichus mawsoni]